jgi:hypothetical protein
LAERFFQYAPQQLRNISQILSIDANGVEGTGGDVELVAQTNIDI